MSESVPVQPPPSQLPPLDPLPAIIPFASVNLLAGASGVGKTCLTAWLATRFRDCLPIFGQQPNPVAKIAYLCLDRGWRSTKVWLERVGYPDIAYYSLTDDATFDINRLYNKRARVQIFRECLDRLELIPNSLVFVDPIALFMGGNLNDYDTCAVALIGIRRICEELGITIFGLSHASKQKNDKADQYKRLQDRILGSAAQHGYGDTQMYLASPDETGKPYYTFLLHPHLAKPREIFLDRAEDTGLFFAAGTLHEVEAPAAIPSTDTPSPLDAQINEDPYLPTIYDLIADEAPGTTTGTILDAARATLNISRATTFRVINLLAQAGWIVSLGRGRWKRVLPLRLCVAPQKP